MTRVFCDRCDGNFEVIEIEIILPDSQFTQDICRICLNDLREFFRPLAKEEQ